MRLPLVDGPSLSVGVLEVERCGLVRTMTAVIDLTGFVLDVEGGRDETGLSHGKIHCV
jgi:hypothetical protein